MGQVGRAGRESGPPGLHAGSPNIGNKSGKRKVRAGGRQGAREGERKQKLGGLR